MGLAIAGVIANWFVVMGIYLNALEDDTYRMMLPFVAILAAVSLVGLIIAVAGGKKAGGILIIIGSILFVPLGLIGIFGGQKIMGSNAAQTLEQRRNNLKKDNQLDI